MIFYLSTIGLIWTLAFAGFRSNLIIDPEKESTLPRRIIAEIVMYIVWPYYAGKIRCNS